MGRKTKFGLIIFGIVAINHFIATPMRASSYFRELDSIEGFQKILDASSSTNPLDVVPALIQTVDSTIMREIGEYQASGANGIEAFSIVKIMDSDGVVIATGTYDTFIKSNLIAPTYHLVDINYKKTDYHEKFMIDGETYHIVPIS